MKPLFKCILTFLIFVSGFSAEAAKFKGFRKTSDSKVMTIDEPLDRFEEEPDTFLILMSGYAAFYKFPKDKEHADHVREFLNARLKNKKKILLEYNPTTAEITTMSGQ